MKVDILLKQGVLIVRLEGELDIHSCSEFRESVDNAIKRSGAKNIILNFNKVIFIDSSGIGVILGRYKKINALGGKIFGINLQPQVEKIFQLSGLLKLIKKCSSETDALDFLYGRAL